MGSFRISPRFPRKGTIAIPGAPTRIRPGFPIEGQSPPPGVLRDPLTGTVAIPGAPTGKTPFRWDLLIKGPGSPNGVLRGPLVGICLPVALERKTPALFSKNRLNFSNCRSQWIQHRAGSRPAVVHINVGKHVGGLCAGAVGGGELVFKHGLIEFRRSGDIIFGRYRQDPLRPTR
jgi:hypothetical protein